MSISIRASQGSLAAVLEFDSKCIASSSSGIFDTLVHRRLSTICGVIVSSLPGKSSVSPLACTEKPVLFLFDMALSRHAVDDVSV